MIQVPAPGGLGHVHLLRMSPAPTFTCEQGSAELDVKGSVLRDACWLHRPDLNPHEEGWQF